MLKNVIENYLTSIREVQFFAPFKVLLENLDYYDVHLLHGPTEFGKDFIAKKNIGDKVVQYSFQIKAGDINLSKFTGEIKPQLLEIITNKISHPNFNSSLTQEIVFVTTGIVKPPATISFQEFNSYIQQELNAPPIVTWERSKILSDFTHVGIEPFYELHNSPEFVSRFFDFFAKIKQEYEFTPFDINTYTEYWLELDLTIQENKLQVLFEGYFFSKLLFDNKDYYSSIMFLAALCRALMKANLFDEFKPYIIETILDAINEFHVDFTFQIESDRKNYFLKQSLLSIIIYPTICLKSLEMLSLHFLLSENGSESIKKSILDLLTEKGSFRPISDNYGMAVFLTCLALIKLDEKELLKKYLINLTVWLCDRYQENGLATIGYKPEEEYQQILSEHLSGLEYIESDISFLSTIILDIAIYLEDEQLYNQIVNDFHAVRILPVYYHVNTETQLYNYDNVVTETDHAFSKKYIDNYATFVQHRKDKFNVELAKEEALLLMFQLKDRYFPNIIFDLI